MTPARHAVEVTAAAVVVVMVEPMVVATEARPAERR